MPKPATDIPEFTTYYEKHKKAIFNYILYRVGFNRETAEDLTSEIFLKAFEHFETYDRGRPFKTWIFTIAHNHLVNFYAKQRETLPLNEAIGLSKEEKSAEEIDHDTMIKKILRIISKLPEGQRETIILRYINDLGNNEIAEITGKEEGAVRTSISRAITAIRDHYNFQLAQE